MGSEGRSWGTLNVKLWSDTFPRLMQRVRDCRSAAIGCLALLSANLIDEKLATIVDSTF